MYLLKVILKVKMIVFRFICTIGLKHLSLDADITGMEFLSTFPSMYVANQ